MLKALIVAMSVLLLSAPAFGQQKTFVYTADEDGPFPLPTSAVSGFVVNQDGSMSEIDGSPFLTGGEALGGVIGQSHIIIIGNYLYSANSADESIAAFSIDPGSGRLSAVADSPYKIGVRTNGSGICLAATPDGRYVFASVPFSQVILTFAVQPDGSLSGPTSNLSVLGQAYGLAVSPNGDFLVIASPLTVFRIKQNGSLRAVQQKPSLGTPSAVSVTFNCSGTMLFAIGETSLPGAPNINVFAIDSSGTLTESSSFQSVPGFGFVTTNIYFSPSTGLVFATDSSVNRSISTFDVSPGGTLTMTPDSPLKISGAQLDDSSVPWGVATNLSGSELFVAINRNLVGAYLIGPTGSLTPAPGSPYLARGVSILAYVTSLAVYPSDVCSAHFDRCLQDESGNIFRFNSTFGTYEFSMCGGEVNLSGTGKISTSGQTIRLTDSEPDRQVKVSYDLNKLTGKAKITIGSGGTPSKTVIKQKTGRAVCSCGST